MTPLLAASPPGAPTQRVDEDPHSLDDYHAKLAHLSRAKAVGVRHVAWAVWGGSRVNACQGQTELALEELVAQGRADRDISGRYRARTPEAAPLPSPPSEPPADHRWEDDGGAQEHSAGDPTPGVVGQMFVRDPDAPCADFIPDGGTRPTGDCATDGHCLCGKCPCRDPEPLEWPERLAELEAALPPRSVPEAAPDAVHEQAVGDFVYLEPEVAPEPAAPVEAVDEAPLPAPENGARSMNRAQSLKFITQFEAWQKKSQEQIGEAFRKAFGLPPEPAPEPEPPPRTIEDLARKWSCNPVGEVLRAKGFVAEVATRREKLERAIAELTEARDVGIEALAELDRMMGTERP